MILYVPDECYNFSKKNFFVKKSIFDMEKKIEKQNLRIRCVFLLQSQNYFNNIQNVSFR